MRVMKRSVVILAILAIAAIGTAGTASAHDRVAHAAARCGSVGPPQSDVGLYKIWAQRLSCGRARAILRRWYYDASAPDAGPSGWACRTYDQGRWATRTYCFRGRQKLSFTRYLA